MDLPFRNRTADDDIAEAHARYAAARPVSAALHAEAVQVLPGGNTRSNLGYRPFPTAMARGAGNRLWDVDGHEYLDLCGDYTAGLFGHTEPRVQAAVDAAMRNGIGMAAVGRAEAHLARLICARFHGMDRIRFTNSGTEANLLAITAARAFTGRTHVMVARGAYHGSVLTFPLSGPAPITVPFPVAFFDYNDAEGAAAAIHAHAGTLAAVVLEPMMGGGGCIPATPAFLHALRQATTEAGALLVFDEVMTSRMSEGGLQARIGLSPDLTTLGKYMAGGMGFGAFGGRAGVMDQFAAALPHAGTFNNNAPSMAAGVVALGEVFTAEAADEFYALGERMRARLNAVCAAQCAPGGAPGGAPVHFSGLGTMATIHFRPAPILRPYAATALEDALRELFFFDMLDAGIYLARRGMVALSLPTTDTDLDRFAGAVGAFLDARTDVLAGLMGASPPLAA